MNSIVYIALRVVSAIITIFQYALIVRALMSWFVSPMNRFYVLLGRITEPLVAPFRSLSMRISKGRLPIDLAPLFAYLALMLLGYLINLGMNIALGYNPFF